MSKEIPNNNSITIGKESIEQNVTQVMEQECQVLSHVNVDKNNQKDKYNIHNYLKKSSKIIKRIHYRERTNCISRNTYVKDYLN